VKLTATQQRVMDVLCAVPGRRLRYFAPGGYAGGHFCIDRAKGEEIGGYGAMGGTIPVKAPHTAIPALARKGALKLVGRFASDATQSVRMGNLRGYEYIAAPTEEQK
jgi:hypothetical protein